MAVTIKGFASDWSVPEPAKSQLNGIYTRRDRLPLNAKDYGAVGDWGSVAAPGTNNVPAFQSAVAAASAQGRELVIPAGKYWLNITSAADVIKLESNTRIRFEPGADVVFGMEGVYYPAFSAVNKQDIALVNPSFLWTGKLTVGPGLDFTDADGLNMVYVDRVGSSQATYWHCAAIFLVGCARTYIRDFRGRSVTQDGQSVIHNWIFNASCTDFFCTGDNYMDDMVVGILAQGGGGGEMSGITARRMSQDVGIPGHVIYSFRNDTIIRDIYDHGTETGLVTSRQLSHTISQKGNSVTITGIRSRRAAGPLNTDAVDCVVSDVYWRQHGTVNTVYATPMVYFLNGAKGNAVSNVRLLATRDMSAPLFGGDVTGSRFDALVLTRKDAAVPPHGFLQLRGIGGEIDATLQQQGTAQAKINASIGPLSNTTARLALQGFTKTPVFDVSGQIIVDNDIILTSAHLSTTDPQAHQALGPLLECLGGVAITSAGAQRNRFGYEGGIASHVYDAGPSTTVNVTHPVNYGTYYLTVTVSRLGGDWRTTQTFLVNRLRHGGGGNTLTNVQAIGTKVNYGAGFVDAINVALTDASLAVTGNITETTTQDAGHRVHLSFHKIGS